MESIPMHLNKKQVKKVVKLPKMSIRVPGLTIRNTELENKIMLD